VIVAFQAAALGRGCDRLSMQAREYRLTVDGELSEPAAQAFEGMTLTREEGKTALVGLVRDQAQLQGLLQRISDLGLTLLSANAIDEKEKR
jgi:hypothetical protein